MLFNVYVFFLIASGVLMLVMGSLRAPYAKRSRVANFIFGGGFTLYGLYLLLFFGGGHYILFVYVFVLPVLMAVRFFRDRAAYRAAQSAGPPPGYGQAPAGYGQAPAGYGQQGGYGQQSPFQP